jgi:hypothetical protein
MKEELIDKYVKPYYTSPDRLAENNGEVLSNWKASIDFEEELTELLTNGGWRNRVVAATVIGATRDERFLDQIYNQAKKLNEYHAAKSYAFSLLMMENEKARDYLNMLVQRKPVTDYSKNLQKYYKAALTLIEPLNETSDEIEKEKEFLRCRKEKWKNFA